jgi:hypothetical protein
LQFTPLWTFSAIAGAESGIDDKEKAALAKELAEAPLFKEALVREVLLALAGDLANQLRAYGADTRDVLKGLGDMADVLDRRATPEEAKNFKNAMLLIGRNIAQSSGGGFLGTGDKVSDREKAAFVLVAAAMRVKIE